MIIGYFTPGMNHWAGGLFALDWGYEASEHCGGLEPENPVKKTAVAVKRTQSIRLVPLRQMHPDKTCGGALPEGFRFDRRPRVSDGLCKGCCSRVKARNYDHD